MPPPANATIRFSNHARVLLEERGLQEAWVFDAILSPEWEQPDAAGDGRRRSFKAIPERDGRILRVVWRMDGPDILVVTVFLDRRARPPH